MTAAGGQRSTSRFLGHLCTNPNPLRLAHAQPGSNFPRRGRGAVTSPPHPRVPIACPRRHPLPLAVTRASRDGGGLRASGAPAGGRTGTGRATREEPTARAPPARALGPAVASSGNGVYFLLVDERCGRVPQGAASGQVTNGLWRTRVHVLMPWRLSLLQLPPNQALFAEPRPTLGPTSHGCTLQQPGLPLPCGPLG
jgi:hypothetical protein